MKVTSDMIDKQLRLKGRFMKTFVKYNTVKELERKNKISTKIYKGKTSKKINCQERYITKRNGEKLRVCIYSSLNKKPDSTGLLWIHGGGYSMCVPEEEMTYYEQFIKSSNCVIVAPDYAHSIHKPYPAAFDDCYETLYWMKMNADELGINKNQLFVGGESCGGGLSAAVSLYARDKKEVDVSFQMLLYPMLDDRMNSRSAVDNNGPVWNSKSNYLGWKLYLGDLFESDNVPKYAAPSRETQYLGLPPTFAFVGDIDVFHDETLQYITSLRKSGVKTHFSVYKGCFHGFDTICPKSDKARKATKEMLSIFKYATENYYTENNGIL